MSTYNIQYDANYNNKNIPEPDPSPSEESTRHSRIIHLQLIVICDDEATYVVGKGQQRSPTQRHSGPTFGRALRLPVDSSFRMRLRTGEAVDDAYALLPITGDVGGGRMEAYRGVDINIWGRSCNRRQYRQRRLYDTPEYARDRWGRARSCGVVTTRWVRGRGVYSAEVGRMVIDYAAESP